MNLCNFLTFSMVFMLQTLTPYMQSAPAKEIVRAMGSYCSEISSSGDQEQGNFSIELWKNAFRDSCERICPVRAGGHACGCLPLLSRLVKFISSIFLIKCTF